MLLFNRVIENIVLQYCIAINSVQAVEMPKPYIDTNGKERIPCVYFKNHHRQLPVPFVIYADFESVTEKVAVVNNLVINLIQNNIKSIQLAVLVIKLFAIMIRNILEI